MGQFIDYGNFDFIFLVFLYLSDCFKKMHQNFNIKKLAAAISCNSQFFYQAWRTSRPRSNFIAQSL
jgi:hypothetical protein